MNNSKKLRNCEQDKCAFIQMGFGCRACDTCKTESYLLNDDCDRCWNCSKDAGILRWTDDGEIKEKQLQMVKLK
jgi:hypothetical protein